MLHEAHLTSAPNSTKVSINTAVWIVICKLPAIFAPSNGFAEIYFCLNATRPGISVSAIFNSFLPNSANERSATI